MMDTVSEFSGEHRFLSNFWPAEVRYGDFTWPTVEHAYQAAKFDDPKVHRALRAMSDPGKVKRYSRQLTPRAGWNDDEKLKVMADLLRQKFSIPDLRARLAATGFVPLEEGNLWNDTFWGICPPRSGRGRNHLGKLLMQIRADIHKEYLAE